MSCTEFEFGSISLLWMQPASSNCNSPVAEEIQSKNYFYFKVGNCYAIAYYAGVSARASITSAVSTTIADFIRTHANIYPFSPSGDKQN